jgi:hypothetical protein
MRARRPRRQQRTDTILQAVSEIGMDGDGKGGEVGFYRRMERRTPASFAALVARAHEDEADTPPPFVSGPMPTREEFLEDVMGIIANNDPASAHRKVLQLGEATLRRFSQFVVPDDDDPDTQIFNALYSALRRVNAQEDDET